MQKYNLSFNGQTIFIGIDVHLKNWQIAVLTEAGNVKRLSIGPSAKVLFDFLRRNYPDGTYQAVYESGYSGFSTYYALKEYGIECKVVHAADVPTSQYESLMKTDRIDAEKLARSLRAGLITSIYIREPDSLDDRSVVRIRKKIQKQLDGCRSRIKHLLHTNGVELPERFSKPGHWSNAFTEWLRHDVRLLSCTRVSLDLLISQAETMRKLLLEATLNVRMLSRSDKYRKNFDLLVTIPGIGLQTAMCILTEVYDVNRFHNEREFASYLGLIPTCHCSGESVSHGEKTFRGNKHVGPMLVEASWRAIDKDEGLGCCFTNYTKRMTRAKAIIPIARKMSNIVYAILKNGTPYMPYKFNG